VCFKVEIEFFENARSMPPNGDNYRPHFVVEESDVLLGIQFKSLARIQFGQRVIASVFTLYDGVDYNALSPGSHFKILEGRTVVGKGMVIGHESEQT